MTVYHPPRIPSHEITPRDVYLSRRTFMGAAAGLAATGFMGGQAFAAPLSATPGPYKLDEAVTPK